MMVVIVAWSSMVTLFEGAAVYGAHGARATVRYVAEEILAEYTGLPICRAARVPLGPNDVKAALKKLDEKGLKASDVQGHIDPDNAVKLAEKMRSGEFKNELMDQPVIRQGDVQLSGHHRTVAAEMTDFPLEVKTIPAGSAGTASGQPWSGLPLKPGRR